MGTRRAVWMHAVLSQATSPRDKLWITLAILLGIEALYGYLLEFSLWVFMYRVWIAVMLNTLRLAPQPSSLPLPPLPHPRRPFLWPLPLLYRPSLPALSPLPPLPRHPHHGSPLCLCRRRRPPPTRRILSFISNPLSLQRRIRR